MADVVDENIAVEPVVRGWCPGALRPMESGDGLVVRVRPRSGRLTPEQAGAIADAARKYGSGIIDLSNRANVQLRGVREAGHGDLIARLTEAGLIDPSAEVERRRNIVVAPFWRDGDDTLAIAERLADAMAQGPRVPAKFGFAVDCGATSVLGRVAADIRIERGASGGLIVRADGAVRGMPVAPGEAPGLAVRLAEWFLSSGGAPDGRGRMARHLAAGTPLPSWFRAIEAPAETGPLPGPGRHDLGLLVGFAYGQLHADALEELARAATAIRVTPWRMLLLEGAKRLEALPDGVMVSPDDPRLAVEACSGAPFCPQAHAATRPLADRLARRLPEGQRLHVSGCVKSCAMRGPADHVLIATPRGFDLVRDGRPGDEPVVRDLEGEAIAADPDLIFGKH
ncbi:MAG: precorrin-3B synthase [Rhizobiales bacterium]|nr:precorrin-3B synthase [Hyphomicrobiales bacterium]